MLNFSAGPAKVVAGKVSNIAIALGVIASTAAFSTVAGNAASLQPAPNVNDGYGSPVHKMVCGQIASSGYGTGFGFWRLQWGSADVLKVTHYQTTSAGLNSSSTSNDLPRGRWDYAAVGMAPYDPLGRVFILGGRVAGPGFSGEYFKYGTSGFTAPSNGAVPPSPNGTTMFAGGLVSGRAGLGASVVDGTNFLVFGGYDAGGMRSEVFSVNVGSTHTSPHTWTAKASMPVPLKNAKALPSGAAGAIKWIYVVGGGTAPGIDNNNRRIFRYHVSGPNADQWFVMQDASGNDLIVPGTKPVEIASVQGAMMILTQSEDSQSMQMYRFTHPATEIAAGPGALGTAKGATLSNTGFAVPLRSRTDFGLLRCSPDAWVVGGWTGHGSTFQNREKLVDKLTRFP